MPTRLLIDGQWRDSSEGEQLEVIDPATEDVVGVIAGASVEDANDAVRAAHEALPAWAATPQRERAETLRKAYELMTAASEGLARLIVLENGKALPDARAEVAYAAEFFRWYAEEAVRLVGEVQTAPAGAIRIPIGIAALVTPWNFPAAMATRKIGPALAAGCTVILKPASEMPLTALTLGRLLLDAGVPAGVVNVIPARRAAPVVSAMLADSRVRKLSFTGSTEIGRILLRTAADNVVSCSMELGGNAPFIVCADADLDEAVAGALIAKMRNGGEACTAANRFFAHRSIARQFTKRLADAMSRLRVGPGLEPNVDVGPLVNAASRDKVASLVADAADRGATVVTGGNAPDRRGYFYEPTVLGDVTADAVLLQAEIFGSVAPVVPFDTDDEVIRLANDTEYGLVGYVYTRDLARGLRMSEALESGMIGLNRPVVSDPAAPFGGVEQSGLGREGGHEGLLEFTESKYIAVSW